MSVVKAACEGGKSHLIADPVPSLQNPRDVFLQATFPTLVQEIQIGKIVLHGVPQPKEAQQPKLSIAVGDRMLRLINKKICHSIAAGQVDNWRIGACDAQWS